jgi:AcrR family transcriptional regulator
MRGRIAAAAMELFLAEGFEKTSMRRIADAIGYTPGALYSYFEDKEDVLFALQREGFARLRAALEQVEAEPLSARERLARVGEEYLRFAFENPQYYELLFILSDVRRRIAEQETWNEGLDTYEFLLRAVRAAMAEGVIPAGDVDAVGFALWSHVHGTASLLLRGRCVMIPDEQLPALVTDSFRWLLGAITAQAKPRPPARPRTRARTKAKKGT